MISERNVDELSRANEELRVDIDKWKEAKDREMNKLMKKVADNHIDFHQKVSTTIVTLCTGLCVCVCFGDLWFWVPILKEYQQPFSLSLSLICMQCFDEWEVVLRLLKNADEAQPSENGDTPEHRKRDMSQSESIEPSTSLVDDDLVPTKGIREEDEERVEGVPGHDDSRGTNTSGGQQTVTQLPGLFDEEDPESNKLFSGAS